MGMKAPFKIMPDGKNLLDEQIEKREEEFLECYVKSEKNHPLKLLLRLCGGYKKELIIAVVFCALQLSAILYLPIAMANVIDAIVADAANKIFIILLNLCIALFLLIINFPMQKIYMRYRNDATRAIEAELRAAMVIKLQKLSFQFNKEMASGKIQSKIVRDAESVRGLISNLLTNGVHIIVNLTVTVAVLLIKGNYLVILFFVLCGPMAAFLSKIYKKRMLDVSHSFRKAAENTNARVNDMVELIPVTKAHALGEVEAKRMSHEIGIFARKGYEFDDILSSFSVTNWIVMQYFELLCLALTAFLALKGAVSVGSVTMYMSYFGTFVGQISSIIGLLPALATGFESINSIGEILACDDVESNSGKTVLADIKGQYEFKNVHFNYRDDPRPVLNGLDLTVNAGETVALVGESGSGKSTIMNLVSGFHFPTSGQMLVDGVPIEEIDLESYRSNMAVVLQNSILFSGSVRDNITYGLNNVTEEQINKVIEQACLSDVIEILPNGLNTLIGEHGNKLSGGQRQRISIARALIRNPKIIVLDEATSALDTVSEKHIQTAIENLANGKTTFIVAHRLSTVKNADKIAVIKDGRCVEFGTYDELIAQKGEFYHFRNLQI